MPNPVSRTAALMRLAGILCFLIAARTVQADAPAGKIKNVLFIISDDLKASVLGCYGDRFCKTPNIDKLASEGMVFDRAYCQGTSCAPSRFSLMFSRYKDKQGVNLGEHLRTNGFHTARVGKIYHMRVPGDIIAGTNGLDIASSWTERFNMPGQEAHTPGDYACLNLNIFTTELEGRQSTKMPHRMFVSVKYEGDGSDQPDHKAATKAVELLRKHRDERFFLAVGLIRPHYPMVAPQQYFEPYDWKTVDFPEQRPGDLDDIPKAGRPGVTNVTNPIGKYPDNQRRMWAAYYAAVTFMDEQVGRIIDELERLGLRDSTAIVFTSDHGYHLGEHGFWQKSNLHEEVLRVPLIMSVPGYKPGRSRSIVELMDIYPTVSELAGIDVPQDVQGVSLKPVLADSQAAVKPGALSFNKGYSFRTPGWHYMQYNDGSEELYDMQTDPDQFTNLASSDAHVAELDRQRKALKRRLRDQQIPGKSR